MKAFFRQLLFAESSSSRAPAVILLVLLLFLTGWIYVAARTHGRIVNTNMVNNDQKKFVSLAMKLKDSGYRYVIPRQRGPGYPYFLSLFFDQEMDEQQLFGRAKQAGIVLALVLLAAVFLIARRFLPAPEAALACLIPGLIVFPMKAAYVQPELTVSTLVLVCAVALACLIRNPSWFLAAAAACSLALWHFFKPSTLAMLALFLACYAGKHLWILWKKKFDRETRVQFLRAASIATLVPILFLVLQSPYLKKSHELFGDPFYSAYTKYYMWLDNREQTIRFGELGAAKGKLELPPEESPGPMKYWREHSLREIVSRPFEGLKFQLRFAEDYYPGYRFFFIFYGVIALAASVARFSKARAFLREYFFEIIFVASFVGAYALLYGWYAFIGFGPRFIVSISLVPLFYLILWTHRITEDWTVPLSGNRIAVRKAVNLAAAACLAYFGWGVLTGNVLRAYAGG